MPDIEAGDILKGIPRGNEMVCKKPFPWMRGVGKQSVVEGIPRTHAGPNETKLFSGSSPHSVRVGANSPKRDSAPGTRAFVEARK